MAEMGKRVCPFDGLHCLYANRCERPCVFVLSSENAEKWRKLLHSA